MPSPYLASILGYLCYLDFDHTLFELMTVSRNTSSFWLKLVRSGFPGLRPYHKQWEMQAIYFFYIGKKE